MNTEPKHYSDQYVNMLHNQLSAAEKLLHAIESADYRPFAKYTDVLYAEITMWQEKARELLDIEEGE